MTYTDGRVSLIGPFRATVGDSGLVDPADNGLVALTVPSGSLYRALVLLAEQFDEDSQVTVSVGAHGPLLAGYMSAGSVTAGQELHVDAGVTEGGSASNVAVNLPIWALASEDTELRVAVFSLIDPPTEGALDVYVMVATTV